MSCHTAPGFSVLDPTTTCDLSVAYGVVPSELAPPLPPATRGGTQEIPGVSSKMGMKLPKMGF